MPTAAPPGRFPGAVDQPWDRGRAVPRPIISGAAHHLGDVIVRANSVGRRLAGARRGRRLARRCSTSIDGHCLRTTIGFPASGHDTPWGNQPPATSLEGLVSGLDGSLVRGGTGTLGGVWCGEVRCGGPPWRPTDAKTLTQCPRCGGPGWCSTNTAVVSAGTKNVPVFWLNFESRTTSSFDVCWTWCSLNWPFAVSARVID